MSKPKFTPGPYSVSGNAIENSQGITLASVYERYDTVEREANRHLFAAAPDLYKALEAVLPYVDLQHISPTLIMAEAALKKARGES